MIWDYNIEDLTRYFREGKGIHWCRDADDPVGVELKVDKEGRTTGRICLTAYLTDNEVAYRDQGIRYSTATKFRNIMNLTRRMEILQSRGLQADIRLDYRGVEVSYDRNISTESDLSDMMVDIASVTKIQA